MKKNRALAKHTLVLIKQEELADFCMKNTNLNR